MKKSILYATLVSFFFLSCTTDREIKAENVIVDPNSELVYYWNFNTTSDLALTSISADYSNITPNNAFITYEGTGDGLMDIKPNIPSTSPNVGYDNNMKLGAIAGTLLKARNPSDTRSLVLKMPTTGYKNIIVQFATARSNKGATIQSYSYSLDGITYTTDLLETTTYYPTVDNDSDTIDDSAIKTLDFSLIPGANNNANFKIKIDFGGPNAANIATVGGNNRFDNVSLEGIPD